MTESAFIPVDEDLDLDVGAPVDEPAADALQPDVESGGGPQPQPLNPFDLAQFLLNEAIGQTMGAPDKPKVHVRLEHRIALAQAASTWALAIATRDQFMLGMQEFQMKTQKPIVLPANLRG